ncbi:MAG: tetratricopeptide (TPR) repeat protein [Candidatus Paceibacteria bacterium]|jgi:tetratricopeptide (TPR) repeat protein
MMKLPFLFLLCCFFPSCSTMPSGAEFEGGVEARSFSDQPLLRPAFSEEIQESLEAKLADAEAEHASHPEDEMAAIWHGRRLAYLGRYREAVGVFSAALEVHPSSYKLLRHRGHRYITLRRLDDAVRDLRLASSLARKFPDLYEPDGAPNPAGILRSTTRSNIEYHLGLALYLAGNYQEALAAWDRCLFLSQVNDDMLVATTYWTVLTLWRLDRRDDANSLLGPIRIEMDIIENHDYHHLLLFYKGLLVEADMIHLLWKDGLQSAALGFGVAAWNLAHDHERDAQALFNEVLEATPWAAFGHIAAEAELAR